MIDKSSLQMFRKHMVAAAKEAGVNLEIGTITFNEGYFKFSAKGYVIGGDGKREEFEKYAAKKGYSKSWYGMKFRDEKETLTIVGVRPRARKYTILLKTSDGKESSCSPDYVRSHVAMRGWVNTGTPTNAPRLT